MQLNAQADVPLQTQADGGSRSFNKIVFRMLDEYVELRCFFRIVTQVRILVRVEPVIGPTEGRASRRDNVTGP